MSHYCTYPMQANDMFRACGRRHRSGFTLIELAIVMGVIAAIMGAIWYAASNARELQKENAAVTELLTVAQNMINLMEGQTFPAGTPPNNITSAMLAAQVIPPSYADSVTAGTADHPWKLSSFAIYAYPSGTYHLNNRAFRLSFYDVPYQGCLALLRQATACDVGQLGCPVGALTNENATIETIPAAGATWQATMNTAAANTLCTANPTPPSTLNSVEFDYLL